MKNDLKELRLNNSALFKSSYFYQEGTKGILLHKDVENDLYHVLIENELLASKDDYLILNKKEFMPFSEKVFRNQLESDFGNIEIYTNRYQYDEKGEIHENQNYRVDFFRRDKILARFQRNMENDYERFNERYYDEKFKSTFKEFLLDKDDSVRNLFKTNFIDLDILFNNNVLLTNFINYASMGKYGLRNFEEQLAHDYIEKNQLNPNILRRLRYKERLIKSNFPIVDLQMGKFYKITKDVKLSNGKQVKKGDFYQIVKRWNDSYYFELLNMEENNNQYKSNKAIVFNGNKSMISELLREITQIEEIKLKKSKLIKGFQFGEEVEFTVDKLRVVGEEKEVWIPKGSKGFVLEYDHKVRMMIVHPETNSIMFKDLYRSEVFKTTKPKNNKLEWLALPYTTSTEMQGKWFKELPTMKARLYHNGEIVGELDHKGEIYFKDHQAKSDFNKQVNNLFDSLPKEIKKMATFSEKEKDIIVSNYLLKTHISNSENPFVDHINKVVKSREEMRKLTLH